MRHSSTISSFVSAIAVVLLSQPAEAIDFPFDAIVNVDEALVRSGTGGDDADYTTIKLRRGDKIKVLHQEFGGWYKIAPPEGSFSWVREDFIKREGDLGIVEKDTMDIIGSETGSPKFEVRNLLRKGEVVEIISKAETLERGPRSTPMVRIRPPRGEFRFIRQRDVVELSQYVEPKIAAADADSTEERIDPFEDSKSVSENAADPMAKDYVPAPVTARESASPDQLPGGANFELARTVPREETTAITGRLPESASQGISMADLGFQAPGLADPNYASLSDSEKKQIEAAWDELKVLDDRFRSMRQKPVAQWSLPELRRRYEALKKTPDAHIRRQVERRLTGLGRYEAVFQEVAEVQDILRQTEERDEKIRQSYLSGRQSVSMQKPVRTTIRPSGTIPPPSAPSAIQRPQSQQLLPQQSVLPPARNVPIVRQPPTRRTRFDGAGIIQRATSARGGARHILVAPDGRFLAYLQAAPGINLDRFLGQSMGLFGPRQYRRDLNSDFMVVRQLTPVRLRP